VTKPASESVDQLVDRRGLVPGGLEVGYEIEVRHA
jgi:hypothetical protein